MTDSPDNNRRRTEQTHGLPRFQSYAISKGRCCSGKLPQSCAALSPKKISANYRLLLFGMPIHLSYLSAKWDNTETLAWAWIQIDYILSGLLGCGDALESIRFGIHEHVFLLFIIIVVTINSSVDIVCECGYDAINHSRHKTVSSQMNDAEAEFTIRYYHYWLVQHSMYTVLYVYNNYV